MSSWNSLLWLTFVVYCHPRLLRASEFFKPHLHKKIFFAVTAQKNGRWSSLLSLQYDAMNLTISTLQQGEHSNSVFYLSLLLHLPDKAAVTDTRNKTLNTWIRENLTQRQQGRKTRQFSPMQYFVVHYQSFTQILTPAKSQPWCDPKRIN